jgi:hypothetical protein
MERRARGGKEIKGWDEGGEQRVEEFVPRKNEP